MSEINFRLAYNLNKFPVYFGFGLNILNANPKLLLDKKYQGKKEIQTNFINVGTKISMDGLSLIPQLWFGSQYTMVSVNIVGTF